MAITDFGKSTLTGASITNPTSLQIGPDGKLYVAEQTGTIKVFTIAPSGSGYAVTDTEVINSVKTIPNHNDNGALNAGVTGRQVTGLIVTEEAGKTVMYVGSSDPRIGAGPSGADLNLDTNSGVITKLTQNSNGTWTAVDIVRGLPRSEENHSINGFELDEDTNTLFVTVGGNTNSGAPSNNFANTPEYALSAAILTVDLDAINALPTKTENGRSYKYDLPTLNDPERANAGDLGPNGEAAVWGGNDGMNQAKWVAGSPVQVYSTGYRNAYDLVFHSNGKLYAVDNGGNDGWGGRPLTSGNGVVTNSGQIPTDKISNDTGSAPDGAFTPNNLDNLHIVTSGYYAGHPNPIRAWAEQAAGSGGNPFNPKWSAIPSDIGSVSIDKNGSAAGHNPKEGVFIQPGQDGALFTWQVSTNGIIEYTSTADGSLTGDLLTVGLNGSITVLEVNAAGTAVTQQATLNVGGSPLDIWAQGNGEPFAGTIWIARYGTNDIQILKPGGGGGTSGPDEDRDNDGLLDTIDRMPVDPNNGTKTIISGGQTLVWGFDGQAPPGPLSEFYDGPGFNGFGNSAGFTGIMKSNGELPEDLYNPDNIIAQGAANVFQIDSVTPGDAAGSANSQQNAFFFGLAAAGNVGDLVYKAVMDNPFDVITDSFQSQGIFIGTGDENNYLKIVAAINGQNKAIIQVGQEVNGVFTSKNYTLNITAAAVKPADSFTLQLAIDVATGLVTPTWTYTLNGQATSGSGDAVQLQGANLAALKGTYTVSDGDTTKTSTLGYGIITTSVGGPTFDALYDQLSVQAIPTSPGGGTASAKLLANANSTSLGASTFTSNAFLLTNTGSVDIASIEIDLSSALLPDLVFDPADGTPAGDTTSKGFTINTAGGVTVDASSFSAAYKLGYKKLIVNFAGGTFDPNETLGFSIDLDPTSIQGQTGSGSSGSVSGLELAGATVKVTYTNSTVQTGQIFGDGSVGGGEAYVKSGLAPALNLSVGGLDNGDKGVLASATQTLQISGGPAGATVRVMVVKGDIQAVASTPPLQVTDPEFDANTAIGVTYFTVTLNGSGAGSVNISSALTANADDRFYVSAVVVAELDSGASGLEAAGLVGDPVIFTIETGSTPPPVGDPNGDEDGDGILNKNDPFAKSAANGAGNGIGFGLDFNGGDPSTGLFGFTGIMANGVKSYQGLYDQPIAGSGSPVSQTSVSGGYLNVTNISDGNATGSIDDQENAFQFGLAANGQSFTVETAFLNPFLDGENVNFRQLGLQIGAGSQDDYIKFVFGKNNTNQFQLAAETGESVVNKFATFPSGVTFANVAYVKLFLDIAANGGSPTATARFELYSGTPGNYTKIGQGTVGTANLDGLNESAFEGGYTLNGETVELAVGVISTSTTGGAGGTDQPFTGKWDYIKTYALGGGNSGGGGGDSAPPGADLASVSAITADSTTKSISITYSDPSGIDLATLGDGDLTILGPGGLTAVVNYLANTVNANGSVTATYALTGPGGGWNASDNGTYVVALKAGQVADEAGNTAGNQVELGGFSVNIGGSSGPQGAAALFVNKDSGDLDAGTVSANTLQIVNQGPLNIESVTIDVSEALHGQTRFDPDGKGFTINKSGGTGILTPSGADGSPPFQGGVTGGYEKLTLTFDDFDTNEAITFSLDLDPFEISGVELTGAKVTITYAGGSEQTGYMVGDGSNGGGEAYLRSGLAPALSLDIDGLGNGEEGVLGSTTQTLQISGGPAGAEVRVLVFDGDVNTSSSEPPIDDDEFGTNNLDDIDYYTVTLNGSGNAAVDISDSLAANTDARYIVNAVVVDNLDSGASGLEAAGLLDDPIVFKVDTLIG